MASAMLDQTTVIGYLVTRGIVEGSEGLVAAPLDGGVSNEVLGITGPTTNLVVKQALGRLRVEDEWLAKVERVQTEGEALELASRLTPGAVPRVVDLDRGAGVLTIERAPRSWDTWKASLLAGVVDTDIATRLGQLLAVWHGRTSQDADVAAQFDDTEAFIQLRVDPYHRTVADRVPEVAAAVHGVADRMLATRRCLVHGDYSPKNILVGPDGLWVIDFEVAHTGDPAFDVAFMLNHLVLKAVHRPSRAGQYAECGAAFVRAYERALGVGWAGDPAHLLAHLGCLLLARAVGKSPAEYLGPEQRDAVRRVGITVINQCVGSLDEVWELL